MKNFFMNTFDTHYVHHDLQSGQLAVINLESRAALLAAKQVTDIGNLYISQNFKCYSIYSYQCI